jgi:hypothetical protein
MPIKPTSLDHLEYSDYRASRASGGGWVDNQRVQEWRWRPNGNTGVGVLHSVDDHPAIIFGDDDEICWYTHGERHRPEHLGPAWIRRGHSEIYYSHGWLHRRSGPAIVTETVSKWYVYNQLHRIDGPAIIHTRVGITEWWFMDEYYDDFNEWCRHAQVDSEMKLMLKLKYQNNANSC